MSRAKGSLKTGGRKRGTPNRFSGEIKDMVRQALHAVGGVGYLEEQARASPTAFLALVARLIPKEIEANFPDSTGRRNTALTRRA